MPGTRSFRQRIFLAILVVALVPAGVAVALGTLGLREIGSTVGTLGPWDAVARSGRELIDAARRSAPDDSVVEAAAEAHGEALSESVRWSRLWGFVAGRVMTVLPWMALLTAGVIALLAFVTARRLARGFSRPIQELVGWTGRISRGEPLPPPRASDAGGVEEFSVLRTSLRRMADELVEARRTEVEGARLKAWTDMARRVAHELKNPLTPMRMAATSLARSGDPGHAESGHILLEEIGRLDEMARTFSQFGRMPEGPPSEVDLGELLETLAARHGGPAGDVGRIAVRADAGLPTVLGHYDVLTRAFRNLLVNALEAVDATVPLPVPGGGRDSTPAVTVLVDRVPEGVRTRIRDRGPGIPEEILESLWEPDVTTKRRGTGLGLAIVRQAVDAHGGRVAARNVAAPHGGAEFEVVLPLDGAGLPDAAREH